MKSKNKIGQKQMHRNFLPVATRSMHQARDALGKWDKKTKRADKNKDYYKNKYNERTTCAVRAGARKAGGRIAGKAIVIGTTISNQSMHCFGRF